MEPLSYLWRECKSAKCGGEARDYDLVGDDGPPWKPSFVYRCRMCGETVTISSSHMEELIELHGIRLEARLNISGG